MTIPLGIVLSLVVAVVLVLGVPALRRPIVSRPIMRRIGPLLPVLGDTERIALDAGTVWWDRDLFSGAPNWRTLLAFKPQPLSATERAFLDGPVQELCTMLDRQTITQLGDLPPDIWSFLKEHRFFGLIIPESYGGLGFSAAAHSAVISKIGSRSTTASVTVMVPNSLGPAELLLHYGTDEQKRHYLPRLASGQEIPCFGLTGPHAGSDAASTRSEGTVCYEQRGAERVLGIRLNWHKRYITLGPVATLIGLAFRLHDPEHLLGETEDLGITVALVPADLPGIDIGARHDPMDGESGGRPLDLAARPRGSLRAACHAKCGCLRHRS
jgi:acyl-CoA dehydrogenase